MIKKLIILCLAAALFLSGCSIVQPDEPDTNKKYEGEPVLMQTVDLSPSIEVNAVLYFLDETSSTNKLAAETRTLQIPQDERAAVQIVDALIEGPVSDSLSPVAQGMELDSIELLPDLINVYLKGNAEMDEQQVMTAKIAIASTLIDFYSVDYVNVFIDGKQTGAYGDTPTGTLQKPQLTLSEELAAYKRNAGIESASLNATLYFLDSSEKFLLPEVRSVTFEDMAPAAMITQIVKEVIKGPEDTYNHLPVIDASLSQFNGASSVESDDGKIIAQLDFEKMPVVLTQGFQDGEQLTIAALTNSIIGFVPGIDGIQISVGGVLQNDGTIYTISDFDSILGNSVLLYFPNSTYTLLSSVSRMVAQNVAGYSDELLAELMNGPSSADNNAIMPAFISGITMDDVNGVYLAGDTAVVNFKSTIQEKMKNISQKNEFIMIYSIVNTLTNIDNIKRVQFLVDDQRVEYLGDGIVCVIDPLVKNPGIIRLS